MKSLLIAIIGLTLLTSCEKKEADAIQQENAFSFKIDGQEYAPLPVNVDIQNLSEIPFVGIYGEFGTEESLFLTIRQDVQPGTHSIDLSNKLGETQSQARYFYPSLSTPDVANSADAIEGTLIIKTNDTDNRRMSGTFFFDTFQIENDDPIFQITDGVFDVSY
ncbi:DUF6252 family protein [Arcticibacterium luteifluviistationis]|uniref:Lipoprotein n=1 Tax=Arcticibacterium luteifluviistationis TaxID=1784714 RepID=A0A2Z4GC35_9BACT|nr:DUF6252 family protein [Arcticibacterium luteifluviistationis]AWV98776.1 hypothetical protein DJ013_11560 [Arcticibacterium luteifluviistationis]